MAAVFVILSLLIGERALRGPAAGSDLSRYHDRTFRVVKVVDGDTVDLDAPDANKPTTRVRLWGVDTPELTSENGPCYYAREASDFTQRNLLNREVHVVLAPQDTRDRYGRLLAFLELERGGTLFNETLIEQGFAYADPRFEHPYKSRFGDVERRAQKADIGLWAGVKQADLPAWKRRLEEHPRREP
jgi:endonuclease YncB( thermonuclease family)